MVRVFMFVFMPLVLAVLTVGVVWLVRTLSESRDPSGPTADEGLELRYARGEIDRDEYLQRRNDLHRRA